MSKHLIFLYLLVAAPSAFAADEAINVSIKTVQEIAYQPTSSAPATVLSLNDSLLASRIQGEVTNIPVQVADSVEAGDLLLELDCRSATANKQSNLVRQSLAEFQLQRAKKLRKGNNISEEALRTRKSELMTARAALTNSEVVVEGCRVLAPFKAEVLQRKVDIGEWVTPGTALMQIIDLAHVEVSAQLPAVSIKALHGINKFSLLVGKENHPLKLRKISGVIDQSSRTREVRLSFVDQSASPGQSGRLMWQQQQWYLPASFLAKRKNKYGVFIVKDNHAHFIAVPDAQEGRPLRVDLAGDVEVIGQGRHSVNDNDLLKIIR